MAWQAPNPSNSTNGPYRRTLQSIQDWSRGVHSVHGAGTAVSVPATGGGAVNALWGPPTHSAGVPAPSGGMLGLSTAGLWLIGGTVEVSGTGGQTVRVSVEQVAPGGGTAAVLGGPIVLAGRSVPFIAATWVPNGGFRVRVKLTQIGSGVAVNAFLQHGFIARLT